MRTRRVKIEKPDTPEEISFQIKSPTKKSRSKPKNLKNPKSEKSKPGRKNSLLEKYIYNNERRDVQHEIDRITMLEHRSLSIKRTRQILTEVCALHDRFIKTHNETFGTQYRKYLPVPRGDEFFMQQETIMLMEDMLDIELQKEYDMATIEKLLVELEKSVVEDTLDDGLVGHFETLKIDMLDKLSALRISEEYMRDRFTVRVTPDSDDFSMPAKRMKIDEKDQNSKERKRVKFTPESFKRKNNYLRESHENTNEHEKSNIPAK